MGAKESKTIGLPARAVGTVDRVTGGRMDWVENFGKNAWFGTPEVGTATRGFNCRSNTLTAALHSQSWWYRCSTRVNSGLIRNICNTTQWLSDCDNYICTSLGTNGKFHSICMYPVIRNCKNLGRACAVREMVESKGMGELCAGLSGPLNLSIADWSDALTLLRATAAFIRLVPWSPE